MRFDVITLFPGLFVPFLANGVARRAFASDGAAAAAIRVEFWNPRDFASGAYRRVDDRPFGGGPGMVMLAEPLASCLKAVRAARGDAAPVALFAPGGRRLDHAAMVDWSHSTGAVLVCGRYEGIDQRFIDAHVDVLISLGDFVLSGGEIAALALLDGVARLLPDVLNDSQSHQQDSFNPVLDGLLDCPHYTRPESWEGQAVPQVLLGGHHSNIERWRREQSLLATARLRPDLLEAARRAGRLSAQDEAVLGPPPRQTSDPATAR
jgi:tRNA (guanine37-N1)-methyltransferase